MISSIYWQALMRKNGISSYYSSLDRARSASPAEARRAIGDRLLEQIRYFGNRADALPEWREAAKARTSDELWRLWPSLPILTKKDLVTRYHPQEMVPRFQLRGKLNCTGGSTGEPTHFFHDHEMVRTSFAATLYCRMRLGWRPGMPLLCLWGSDRELGKRGQSRRDRVEAYLRNDWVVAGYGASDDTVNSLLRLLENHHPAAVYGYSSLLDYVVREIAKQGISIPPGRVRSAWSGAEMLPESTSEGFQQIFGTPILNWYGSRELSVLGYQEQANGGPLFTPRPYLFLEIVDDAGRPVAPGESGRLIWTSTVCHGTPFLRYDIGDLGSYRASDYDESGVRAIAQLLGRKAGLLSLPNGTTVNCLFWNQLFKEFPEVVQFQVALIGGSRLEFRLRGNPLSSDREARLFQTMQRFTHGVPVALRWVEQIPLSRENKLIQVVHE